MRFLLLALLVAIAITLVAGCGGGGGGKDVNPLDYNVRAFALRNDVDPAVEIRAPIKIWLPGNPTPVQGTGHCYANTPLGTTVTVEFGAVAGYKTPDPSTLTINNDNVIFGYYSLK